MLDMRLVRYLAFDMSPQRVAEARAKGLPVLFGDACRPEVLRTGGVERAHSVVITLDNPDAAVRAVDAIKREFPNLNVFCRAMDAKHQRLIQLRGGIAIVPEFLEASLLLGGAVLRAMGVPAEEVNVIIEHARAKKLDDAGIEWHPSLLAAIGGGNSSPEANDKNDASSSSEEHTVGAGAAAAVGSEADGGSGGGSDGVVGAKDGVEDVAAAAVAAVVAMTDGDAFVVARQQDSGGGGGASGGASVAAVELGAREKDAAAVPTTGAAKATTAAAAPAAADEDDYSSEDEEEPR